MPSITTERLILKPHTIENLRWLNRTFNDPNEDYFNSEDPPKEVENTLEDTRMLLDRILSRPANADIIDFAIHKIFEDELIGYCMIARIDRYHRSCLLGISLGWNKANWGKGYASEALQAVIEYCFGVLELNRIGAEVFEFNQPSIKLFERAGFVREGIKRQAIVRDGAFKDIYLYSLLATDLRHASSLS